jgi:hypothetical protein
MINPLCGPSYHIVTLDCDGDEFSFDVGYCLGPGYNDFIKWLNDVVLPVLLERVHNE